MLTMETIKNSAMTGLKNLGEDTFKAVSTMWMVGCIGLAEVQYAWNNMTSEDLKEIYDIFKSEMDEMYL